MAPNVPLRLAKYLRISKADEDDYDAIDRQNEDLDDRIEDLGEVVETYTDHSRSAYARDAKRPDYDRMWADYKAGAFDGVACWEIDRFTRQPAQLEQWIEIGEVLGLVIVTIEETYDLRTEGGRRKARDRANAARSEMELKSKRQKRANMQRARKGKPPSGVRATGYTTDGLELVEDEAAAVAAMFTAFDLGASLRGIGAALSGVQPEDEPDRDIPAGVPTLPRRDGKPGPWPPSSVLGILRNPRYAGWAVHTPKRDKLSAELRAQLGDRLDKPKPIRPEIARDRSGAPVPGTWPAIVSDALFLRVQKRLDDPTRATNGNGTDRKHLGSGLYLCGVCPHDDALKVKSHNTRYRCAGHVMRKRDAVDGHVLEYVEDVLARPGVAEMIAAELSGDDDQHNARTQRDIQQHRDEIARARADYKAKKIDGDLYSEIRTEAEERIAALEAGVVARRTSAAVADIFGSEAPVEDFRDADLSTRRAVIDFLIEVRLYPAPRGRKAFDPLTVKIADRFVFAA